MNSLADLWREAFGNWPSAFRRKGVLIPLGGEPIPFCDFVMSPTILILERPTPDNAGARRVAIPFDRIDTLKYTEPLSTEQFLEAGFVKEKKKQAPTPRPAPAVQPTHAAQVQHAPVPPRAYPNQQQPLRQQPLPQQPIPQQPLPQQPIPQQPLPQQPIPQQAYSQQPQVHPGQPAQPGQAVFPAGQQQEAYQAPPAVAPHPTQ